MKGLGGGNGTLALIMIVFAVVVIGAVYMTTQMSVKQSGDIIEEIVTEGERQFSGFDFETQMVARDSSAQDTDADLDIDLFEWDPKKNSDLVDDNIMDCSGVTPAKFDGSDTKVELSDENFCEINVYKFWRDSSYSGGDSETKVDDSLTLVKADLKDKDDGTEANYMYHIYAGETYLVTVTESATTDNEDVVPMAFLISSDGTTTLDPDELENGNINVQWYAKYYSEASAHSKTKLSGEYEDSEDNNGDLDSSLNGIIDSTLTTATAIDIDGTIELEITKDGYMLVLENPLSQSNAEEPYLVVTPYGEGVNSSGLSSAWEEYGTGDLTGDVGYGTTDVASVDQIIWQGMTACGAVLTDSSTTDAVDEGNENLYTPDCFKDASTKKQGVYGIFDDGATLTIPFDITQITVDYDLAANSTNGQLDYGSGSSPEVIADIDGFFVQSATDRIAQTLG